jgi:hypothetical protein
LIKKGGIKIETRDIESAFNAMDTGKFTSNSAGAGA